MVVSHCPVTGFCVLVELDPSEQRVSSAPVTGLRVVVQLLCAATISTPTMRITKTVPVRSDANTRMVPLPPGSLIHLGEV